MPDSRDRGDKVASSPSSSSSVDSKPVSRSFDYENTQIALIYDPTKADAFETFKAANAEIEDLANYILMATGEDHLLKAPKNATSGIGKGVILAGAGVVGGIGSLIAEPVRGASDGFGGFCKGMVKGVGGLIVLPCVGVTSGVVQMGRGIANAPGAASKKRKGYEWNKEKGVWDPPIASLEGELSRLDFELKCNKWALDEITTRMKKLMNLEDEPREVKDTEYYDVLGVAPDASQGDIKKAYLKLARNAHPDKVAQEELSKGRTGVEYQVEGGGPLKAVEEAKLHFQQIGQAYHILSNPEQRKIYDLSGKNADGLDSRKDDDEAEFKFLFCSEELVPWIGEPDFMSEVESALGGEHEEVIDHAIETTLKVNVHQFEASINKGMRRKAQIELALALERRLEAYLNILRDADTPPVKKRKGPRRGNSLKECLTTSNSAASLPQKDAEIKAWEASVRRDVGVILNQRIGPTLMSMVGWEYCNRAQAQLGTKSFLGHKKRMANFEATMKKAQTYKKLLQSMHKMSQMDGVKKMVDAGSDDAEGMDPELMPAFMETMFQVHGVYAMEQVRKQFKWFFKESLYKQEHQIRATALLRLGTIISEEVGLLRGGEGEEGTPQIDWSEHLLERQIAMAKKADEEARKAEQAYNSP